MEQIPLMPSQVAIVDDLVALFDIFDKYNKETRHVPWRTTNNRKGPSLQPDQTDGKEYYLQGQAPH